MTTIQFTAEELKQLDFALGNCWGDGEWLEWLDLEGGKAQETAFRGAWIKIAKAVGLDKPIGF